ncbi:cytochrome C biosynthesis protein [Shewanella sp. NIFS-20-20]|uniref:cytochrome C biosynthesis protein n=1 Tax=Shewanella sp. NIFS-20-20 TaxID=2853806 RepID=UPI001C495FC5|nr:cytochrome C biosynthesis protein [Shewanella sp. NIFS-20-20]MBV7316511.1 cytochrome C biosynthesis protein [Shewanella sp. NIFS-20-20]
MRYLKQLLIFIVLLFTLPASAADPIVWQQTNSDQELQIPMYFFWSETCPHCAKAHPFVDKLTEHYPWIALQSHQVTAPGALALWKQVATATGQNTTSVPFFAFCGQSSVGYSSDDVTGAFIEQQLRQCYQSYGGTLEQAPMITAAAASTQAPLFATCSQQSLAGDGSCDAPAVTQVQPVSIPFIGTVAPEKLSLPLLTVVLAGVDAFNPCAFFVLLFLLSIMVNAKSRGRMLLVGGIFVFFSGFIYFLFMIAWLNIFELLGAGGDGGTIIMIAGLLALFAGVINIKEFFGQKGKVSLSMSASNRTGLIKRMGKLSSATSLGAMILGTTVLAILANAYELLCTAGFPMIYTSVLTLHDLPDVERYLYLVLYNLVYVIPLAVIVIVFSMTLGKRKLTEKEGESLKLMSGIMMLGLGSMLVLDPTSMQNPVLAIGLILGAIILTFSIIFIRKWRSNNT